MSLRINSTYSVSLTISVYRRCCAPTELSTNAILFR